MKAILRILAVCLSFGMGACGGNGTSDSEVATKKADAAAASMNDIKSQLASQGIPLEAPETAKQKIHTMSEADLKTIQSELRSFLQHSKTLRWADAQPNPHYTDRSSVTSLVSVAADLLQAVTEQLQNPAPLPRLKPHYGR